MMNLTIQSTIPGRPSATVRLPSTFILSNRAKQRAVRKLLCPIPETFIAPEEPDYLWRVEELPNGSLRLTAEAIAEEPRRRTARR